MLGINASLNFHFSSEEVGFSRRFRDAADPNFAAKNVELGISYDSLGGVECIRMSLKGKKFREGWWLDPNCGHALLKYECIRMDKDANEVLDYSIDVRKLDKVAENIWWPVEVCFVSSPFGIDKPWTRIVYRANKVVVNDPNFDEAVFTIPLPHSYLIDDRIRNVTYKVGSEDDPERTSPMADK